MTRRTFDWVLIVALTGSWAVLFARNVSEGLHGRLGYLAINVSSATSPDTYPIASWAPKPSGIAPGDEIRAVDGVPTRGLSALGVYDVATRVARERGSVEIVAARGGSPFEARENFVPLGNWWLGTLTFAVLFSSGAILLALAPGWHLARRYALGTWCFAAPRMLVWGMGPPALTFFEATFLYAGYGVGSVLTVWNSQDFAARAAFGPRWQRVFALVPGVLFGVTYWFKYFSTNPSSRPGNHALAAAIASLALVAIFEFTRTYLRAAPLERRQIRWVVLGFYVALLGTVATTVLLSYVGAPEWVRGVAAAPLLALPLGMTVSVVGQRWLDVDRLVSASASYTIVGICAVGGALALAPRLASSAAPALGIDPAVVQWLFTLTLVLAAVPAHLYLRPRLDRRMFAERHARMSGFVKLLDELGRCSGVEAIWRLASERIDELLEPESLVVYAREGDRFVPRFSRGDPAPQAYAADSLLVRALERRTRPLAPDSRELDPFDRAALETLRVALVVPMRREEGVVAFACLGRKRSGDIYTPEESSRLAALAARCAELASPLPESRASQPHVFRLEGELWTIASGGKQCHLRDMRGLHYLAVLLREPGREFAVADLVQAVSGRPGGSAPDPELRTARGLGDAGPVLDRQALVAYRERVASLDAELADAERCADLGRLERASAEREALLAELESASRGKRVSSDSERARTAVTKAIKAALERISELHPELGAHLSATVRRGYACAYEPDPRVPIEWEV